MACGRDYTLQQTDSDVEENLAGQIMSLLRDDGLFLWRVQFADSSEEDMDCKRLARAIHRARCVRLCATNRRLDQCHPMLRECYQRWPPIKKLRGGYFKES